MNMSSVTVSKSQFQIDVKRHFIHTQLRGKGHIFTKNQTSCLWLRKLEFSEKYRTNGEVKYDLTL